MNSVITDTAGTILIQEQSILNNAGTISANNLTLDNGTTPDSQINNNVGGIINISASGDFFDPVQNDGSISVTGSYNQNAGTLTNTGSLVLEAGGDQILNQDGASIINDISAGRDDPEIMNLAADRRCPYIIMHMQGKPKTMQDNPVYEDVVADIKDFLMQRVDEAQKAGIKKENIVIDPGIGFGKTEDHNLELLNKLDEFVDTGYPVLLGTSRKRFMGSICENASTDKLIGATCATTALGVSAGVKLFRVHDVKGNRQAADIAWSIINF